MAKENVSDIQEELENRFLTYALSTIVSRSLPDVRDGFETHSSPDFIRHERDGSE